MERMKQKWDEIYPEYSFLTDKNLRDQASRTEKNKDVMDTEYVHIRSKIARKLMSQATIEISVLRLPIIQTAVVMKNHNLI